MNGDKQEIEQRIHNQVVAEILGIRGAPISKRFAVRTVVANELRQLAEREFDKGDLRAIVRGVVRAADTAEIDRKSAIGGFTDALNELTMLLSARNRQEVAEDSTNLLLKEIDRSHRN